MPHPRLVRSASVSCLLLCLATTIVWITSYFVPVGYMTAHCYFNGNAPAGSRLHAVVILDGDFYDYQIHLEPAHPTPQLTDRPYRWFGHDLAGLHYHPTLFGFSLDAADPNGDADTVASQISFSFVFVPLTLAIVPVARRGMLRKYAAVVAAIFLACYLLAAAPRHTFAVLALFVWGLFIPVSLGIRTLIRFRKPPRPGYCARCRYNLTGNISGICPECGTPTSSIKTVS